ncbi:MAG: hypothetical protein V3R41_06390 [Gammaproteobacteria bacterium]
MILIFFRDDHFYPIELEDGHGTEVEAAKANAECNPGTIRVENIQGDILWPTLH